MSGTRIAVLQFPGVNCEAESVRALERAALAAEVFRHTRSASELREFAGYLLPGGFSYQDRVRAGALAAKDPLLDVIAERADEGAPVLGICNGAQVLVEAGLVPGGTGVALALARNRMPNRTGYYTRWVRVRIEASPCLFTRHLEPGQVLPMPIAHGEGRFTGEPGTLESLSADGRTPLRYATAAGEVAREFPDLPGGSEASAAAVCNTAGNVMAMMPHAERAVELGALGRTIGGAWGARRARLASGGADPGHGPGFEIFRGLALHLGIEA